MRIYGRFRPCLIKQRQQEQNIFIVCIRQGRIWSYFPKFVYMRFWSHKLNFIEQVP